MNNVSIRNLSVTSNSFIIGDTSMNNVSIRNLSVTSNSFFIGDTSMNNVSINNLSVRGKTTFAGDVSMNNVSILNLSITNLSLVNTTFSGTTIFGNYNANTQQLFTTNYNGYFNGIYNNAGTLELGSNTFQRQKLYYDGTGNMSMIWYASPTDYNREAGRFEVTGINTGVANEKRNGNLNIEFTDIALNSNTINIASPLTPTYTSVPSINEIGYHSETYIPGTFEIASTNRTITTIELPFGTWLIEFAMTYTLASGSVVSVWINRVPDTTNEWLKRRTGHPNGGSLHLTCVMHVAGSSENWVVTAKASTSSNADNIWVFKTRIA